MFVVYSNMCKNKKRLFLKNTKGFSLIELLVVLSIISLLIAIVVPGFIGMQERSRKGAVTRAAAAAESELQAWMFSALKGNSLTEVDSDGNGVVNNFDVNNSTLLQDLNVSNQLCQRYINARWLTNHELSPWQATGSLWIADPPQPGKLSCTHAAGGRKIFLSAQDNNGAIFYNKILNSD